jgi:hypothetical protein
MTLSYYIWEIKFYVPNYIRLIKMPRCRAICRSKEAFSAIDRGVEFQSGKTNDYKIGMCCFSAKYTALRSKNKDWL